MLTSPVYTKLWGKQVVDEANAKTAAVHKKLWGEARKPKVYYACITTEEMQLLKLRCDEAGFYTRSTKIQAVVNAYIDKRDNAVRRESKRTSRSQYKLNSRSEYRPKSN